MKYKVIALAAFLLAGGLSVQAQQQLVLEHTPPTCIRSGEMGLMQVGVPANLDGTLQAYFRRTGTTDWCMVEGTNRGAISSVNLPKFDSGVELEYYFLVVKNRQVLAKSPRIYRAMNTNQCQAPYARHTILLTLDCLPPNTSATGNSMGAGYSIQNSPQPPASPETPNQ